MTEPHAPDGEAWCALATRLQGSASYKVEEVRRPLGKIRVEQAKRGLFVEWRDEYRGAPRHYVAYFHSSLPTAHHLGITAGARYAMVSVEDPRITNRMIVLYAYLDDLSNRLDLPWLNREDPAERRWATG
jgi:hypothetical protein